jgi:hypothetical protein
MLGRLAAVAGALLVLAACSSRSAAVPASPTTPTPPVSPPANHPPAIVEASITPALGVAQLTTFHAHVNAMDADTDPLAIAWSSYNTALGEHPDLDFVACGCRNPSPPIFSPVTVTVSDGKGGRTTTELGFIVAGLTGSYDGYYDDGRGDLFIMRLTQTGNAVTGTFYDYRRDRYGITDPAAPGHVEADGRFTVRFKLESDPDFTLAGHFEPYPNPLSGAYLSNYVGVGRVIGGAHDGHSFIFGEHNPY